MNGRKFLSLVLLLVVVAAAAGFGGSWAWHYLMADKTAPNSALVDERGETVVTDSEEAITTVASKVSPSVVSIVTTVERRSLFDGGQGAGTGVIISKDGYIITNQHVVSGATSVSVVLADGTTYDDVTVVGRDPLNDIAFLKVADVDDLAAATLGDSSKVRIGQQVVAIGNALGQFQTTVTSGIISARGRPIVAASASGTGSESLSDLLQTDAAINSGNSGGPLVDLAGRVIGINTAVATDANGIGFAIPINAARGVIEGVLETGKVSRAYIGVQYVDITADVAASEDLPVRQGAYVRSSNGNPIVADSPADKAGLSDGDIILRINDEKVGERASMSSIVGQYRPGDTLTLLVLRDGKERTLEATLDSYRAR